MTYTTQLGVRGICLVHVGFAAIRNRDSASLCVIPISHINNKQAKSGPDGTRDGMAYPWLDDSAEYLVVAFPISNKYQVSSCLRHRVLTTCLHCVSRRRSLRPRRKHYHCLCQLSSTMVIYGLLTQQTIRSAYDLFIY